MATSIKTYDPGLVSKSSPTPIRTQKRPEYLFIHTVRFWAMFAIVFMHFTERFGRYPSVPQMEITLLVQPFKFGTVAFFLIAGFLVGDRLPASNPLGYVRRRLNRLVPGWAFWFGLLLIYHMERELRSRQGAALSLHLFGSILCRNIIVCLTASSLWFIPNFVVALSCIVMLRRWLNDLRLGAVLLAINLFYGANLYGQWIPSKQSDAIFAFVFYLWLGAWCALRKDRIQSWAAACSPWRLSFWACIAAGIALWETTVLAAHNSPDPLNTLRFGNQIYAVIIVILLARIQRRTWPSFVNVAETTYGVYLSHGLAICLIFGAGVRLATAWGHPLNAGSVLLMSVLLVPTAYYASWQMTRPLASTRSLGWLVGASRFEPRKWMLRTDLPDGAMTQPAGREAL